MLTETGIENEEANIRTQLDTCCQSAFSQEFSVCSHDAHAVFYSRTLATALHDEKFVEAWIEKFRESSQLRTMIVPLDDIKGWDRDQLSGNISHETGRFFSVTGLQVRHRYNHSEIRWDQPIIEQPEVGILGILAKSILGVLHFCLQAKEEPGNIGIIQLSPTVQATYSNYTGAHGGGAPQFLNHFLNPAPEKIIFARLQTEDGGRFLYKSNRNMIIAVGDDFPVQLPEGFIWLTLKQISALHKRDNLINACSRSILSCFFRTGTLVSDFSPQIPAGLIAEGVHHSNSIGIKRIDEVQKAGPDQARTQEMFATFQWIDDRKACNHMTAQRIGLNDLQEWEMDGKGFFSHREKRFFRVVGLRVSSESREVRMWGQPIIENPTSGIIGLLIRKGRNGIEILMQAKAEVGNRSTVQLGPTVQFTQSNYEGSKKLHKPFLYDEFSDPKTFRMMYESKQSEEGARFYREYHLHRVLMLPDEMELEIPDDYLWLPTEHINVLLHLGEQVNSCARSILFCLL